MTGATPAELRDRVSALSDIRRKDVLMYLSGYAPEVLAAALDELEGRGAEAGDG